ncbi:MAG: DUF3806 domain-containing protein [Blastocatellia bacterium]
MNQDEQRISELTDEDTAAMAQQRSLIESYLGNEESRQKYGKPVGKLGLLRALLENKVFSPEQTYELQSMGVVLGDAFARELGMEWIVVENSDGRTPALRYPNTTIIIYPITMISKRIEAGKEVDVFDIFNFLAAKVDELSQDPDFKL